MLNISPIKALICKKLKQALGKHQLWYVQMTYDRKDLETWMWNVLILCSSGHPQNRALQPEEYNSHGNVERAVRQSFKNEQTQCFVAEASQLDTQCEHVLWWAWVISSHRFGSPWWINLLFQDKKESTVSALSVVTAEVKDEITGTVHKELFQLY